MKGRLVKTEQGWFVRYRETTPLSITTEILPLHPDSGIPQDAMCDVLDYDFAEVDFDWCVVVDHNTGKGKEYAKLITPSRKHSITDYGVEGIDSCLEYKENDVEKLAEEEYPIFDGDLLGIANNQQYSRIDFIKGYNKAKETLYTEEQIREAVDMARKDNSPLFLWDFTIDEIIQLLKKPKQ
jgi:hypothetical protein